MDTWSRSLYVSLGVKAIRLGWPRGFEQAVQAARLSDRTARDLILAQVFEDLWPSREQLPEVLAEVQALNLDALCSRETHHGRGLSGLYADLAPGIESRLRKSPGMARALAADAHALGVGSVGPRALAEFGIWLSAESEITPGGSRDIDATPWAEMPASMADQHTIEGRQRRTFRTLLSGTPRGHVHLMAEVARIGWIGVRTLVHDQAPLV